jgi:hypothetical protein
MSKFAECLSRARLLLGLRAATARRIVADLAVGDDLEAEVRRLATLITDPLFAASLLEQLDAQDRWLADAVAARSHHQSKTNR